MRESERFNLFLVEGSDIVNPLVQDVPNYEVIDEQMFKNQNAGVQNATELKSGTVHAITRSVPDAQFITFTATSNYTAGETFTVDGIQVSALTVSGETLPTGAYVINSQVLCVLKGTLLTVYGVGSEVADNSLALNGHPDTYFGTKEEVDNAIDTANAANELVKEVNSNLTNVMRKVDVLHDSSGTALQVTGGYTQIVARDIKQYRSLFFEVWNSGALGYRAEAEYSTGVLLLSGMVVTLSSDQDVSTPFKTGFVCSESGISVIISGNPVHCRIFGVK